VLYKFSEIIEQTQERTHIVHILRNGPSLDGLNFPNVRTNAMFINDMTQVLNLLLSKTGLGFTRVKLFTLENALDAQL
jgi:hypothetical protein